MRNWSKIALVAAASSHSPAITVDSEDGHLILAFLYRLEDEPEQPRSDWQCQQKVGMGFILSVWLCGPRVALHLSNDVIPRGGFARAQKYHSWHGWGYQDNGIRAYGCLA